VATAAQDWRIVNHGMTALFTPAQPRIESREIALLLVGALCPCKLHLGDGRHDRCRKASVAFLACKPNRVSYCASPETTRASLRIAGFYIPATPLSPYRGKRDRRFAEPYAEYFCVLSMQGTFPSKEQFIQGKVRPHAANCFDARFLPPGLPACENPAVLFKERPRY